MEHKMNGSYSSKNNQPDRKKRLSKKERKILKKKQKQQPSQTSIDKDDNHLSSKSHVYANSSNCCQRERKEETEDEFKESYVPVKVPSTLSSDISYASKTNISSTIEDHYEDGNRSGEKSLGKWFPNAILIKSRVSYSNTGEMIVPKEKKKSKGKDEGEKARIKDPKSSLVLFYQYATPEWHPDKVKLLMSYISDIARQRNLGGRIRVATEGVNATISAVDHYHSDGKDADDHIYYSATSALRHFAYDLKQFDPVVFAETDFKFLDDLPPDRHFKDCKILPVQELVYYGGIREKNAPLSQGGIHLDAIQYHEMLKRDDAVVIDVRNHYETIIGRFDGQQIQSNNKREKSESQDGKQKSQGTTTNKGGAQYIDPLMRKSTDFPDWLKSRQTKEKLANKTVLMYCTGGVRCERASAILKREMGEDVKEVYQLKGGIERYLKAFPDGGFWRGNNFVFDKREAISADNIHGVGGVVKKNKKKKSSSQLSPTSLPSKCCVCSIGWDRYVGKKKCYTCGVPVLMCDKCMSQQKQKNLESKDKQKQNLSVRCPLCVKENITVPASEVGWTDNGIKTAFERQSEGDDDIISRAKAEKDKLPLFGEKTNQNNLGMTTNEGKLQSNTKKAANSVLKWGGGHASKKKDLRKMKRTMCQFGAECVRKDCYFAHPERCKNGQRKKQKKHQ